MKTRHYLKALAPYVAVVIFWYVWPNAWLAILAYHAQILVWNWAALLKMRPVRERREMLLALPAILAGPILYVLLPLITRTELSVWLDAYRLSGLPLVLMIPYFGFVHPFLEQVHWHSLREATAWSHPVFAGYHMIVLSSLLTVPWLALSFGVLAGTSFAWNQMFRRRGSLMGPTLSHMLADLGVVVAAWARIQ